MGEDHPHVATESIGRRRSKKLVQRRICLGSQMLSMNLLTSKRFFKSTDKRFLIGTSGAPVAAYQFAFTVN